MLIRSPGTQPVWIGKDNYFDSSRDDFNGTIDDVMIFNRVLSEEEVIALYANQSSRILNITFDNLYNGEYSFKAYAQDIAGNVNETKKRV